MHKIIALVGLALVLLVRPAMADDAEVRYVITNGGVDVGGNGQVHYFPVGQHDNEVTWANSGDTVRLPQGAYDAHVIWNDGAARKEIWFANQSFAGHVEKTVEIAVPTTDVRYVITNGGVDAGADGQAHYFAVGNHDDEITASNSGGTVRLAQGAYDVHVTWSDGAANKAIWFTNQNFSGQVEKTVEIAVPTTDVRYVITDGGVDAGTNGQAHYFAVGNHNDEITASNSGGTVRLPQGSYDVHITWSDGAAQKDVWLEHQNFAGQVEKTMEIGVVTADVRYVITNGGVDAGANGQAHYFAVGNHNDEITASNSGGTVRLPQGSYDVHITWSDGAAQKDLWLEHQNFAGHVDKTIEVGVVTTDVRYVITNGGTDVGDKGQVHYFPAGKHDADITWANSGGTVRLPRGSYDVQATFVDGLARKEIWFADQSFANRVDKTIEMGMTLARPTVTATQNGTDVGARAEVTYLAPGQAHEFGDVASGQSTVVEAGSYDIRARFGDAEGWLRAVAINDNPHLTIALQQPKAPTPTPQCQTTMALAAPATTPEQTQGDFPYLPPMTGSTSIGSKADTSPVYVQLPDAKQPELVANSSVTRSYKAPACASVPNLMTLYHDALLKAGWTIVNELHRLDAALTAHYGQNGRNIWAFIHAANDGYSIRVADATIATGKLAADLNSECHLALTGVLFDFDKSTLKPESDGVLQQVGAVMAADQSLRLEVQGHTDGVGGDAYNQRLSEARARAVVTWLTQHGVTVDRLTARGYGKTRPIASNATDEGRARNRRVEIANPACKAKR